MKKRLTEWWERILERIRPMWNRINRLFPDRMGVPARIGVILVLLGLFALTTPALAAWCDRHLLPTLSSMNIFALVDDLSRMTDQMVTDTAGLEQEVKQAGKKLDALERQEQLVTSQLNTHNGIQQELTNQLNGNIEAREWMKQILAREKHTYELTGQVSSKAGMISGQMSETIKHLKHVSGGTAAIAQNTRKMNGQLDSLLKELDQSIRNLRFVSRIPDALRFLERTTGIDLPLPRDSGPSPSSPLPGGSLPKPPNPLPNLLNPLKPKSDDKSNGLLDLLLP